MKTATKLTNREQSMIFALIFLILFLVMLYLFIFPTMEKYTAIQEEVDQIKIKEMQMRQVIENSEQTQTQIISLRKEIADKSTDYYKPMPNDRIDHMITGMLLKNNLKSSSLNIITAVTTPIHPFQSVAEKKDQEEAVKSAASNQDEKKDDKGSEQAASAVVGNMLQSTVSVQATGYRSDFINLVDQVSKNKSISISSFSLKQLKVPQDSGTVSSFLKEYSIAIVFEVFMYEPPSP
ncbi:MAG: hypothetical protein ACOX7H_02895 [Bacillota bacterium]